MMLIGRITKEGRSWRADCDAIGAYTQGTSRSDACDALASRVATMASAELSRNDVVATVTEVGAAGADAFDVRIVANEPGVLAALVLRHQREENSLSLADVAEKLGASSRNAYAAYEQGKREPSLGKFIELLAIVAPDMEMTIGPRSRAAATVTRSVDLGMLGSKDGLTRVLGRGKNAATVAPVPPKRGGDPLVAPRRGRDTTIARGRRRGSGL